MIDERIYVIVPQTVQVVYKGIDISENMCLPEDSYHLNSFDDTIESFPMVHGRLIAQGYHIGRLTERMFVNSGMAYREITAITLVVRNSKELKKVSTEAHSALIANDFHGENFRWFYGEFHDHNPGFYGTENRIHTVTAFGPTTKEIMESVIGHLELY